MEREELSKIIRDLNTENKEYNAYFGIFSYDEKTQTRFIKANKEGVRLYAAELLAISIELEGLKDNDFIDCALNKEWIHGEVLIDGVEFTSYAGVETNDDVPRYSLKSKLFEWGCGAFFIFLFVCMVVGFITIIGC